ncbi:hypothetical protein Pcinc_016395 [Petrolisthes cinctipes]|uniref:WW domain-containing protein n=1 Tax=Petrolisthes cinctipes TaxID=88211 RepID=A0AAE1FR59_PETCI|nr:hypothetical protein Pcinc_016395 [Petrolisthes cinctipes]
MNDIGDNEAYISTEETQLETNQHQQTIILEEVFTQDYDITDQEVGDYCQIVGIDVDHEPQLVPLARAALFHPLPSAWTPVEDSHLGLYFYNKDTGESRWTHPVDSIVRSIVTRHRTNTSSDSYSEEFDTEEDQLISEFLRAQVSEQEASHSDSDALGHSTERHPSHSIIDSHSGQDVPCKPVKVCQSQDSIRGSDEGCDTDESRAVPSNSLIPTDREVKCSFSKREDKVNVTEENINDEVFDNDVSNNQNLVNKEDGRDVRKEKEETECKESQVEESEPGRSRPAATRPATAPAPSMFGGKDSLGRGLGRSPLGPPPLGTPGSLAAPTPLGKPVLGGTQLPSGRVPPIGGQLTPLAPIAAASRGGHLQLAPLKPLGPNPSSPGHQQDSREGRSNPPLRRQPAQKEGEMWGGGRGSGGPERQGRVSIKGGPIRGEGDGAVVSLGSPPKSILKGPVLVSGVTANKGIDRLSLLEPKENKNIRFDFTTDDIDFHTSEEEFEEEELEEEELEEEEEYEDEEEEYDSEAEDLEEEAMLRATGFIDDESEHGGVVLNDASDLLPLRPASSITRPSATINRPGSLRPSQHMPHGPDPWASKEKSMPTQPPKMDKTGDPLQTFRMEREKEQAIKVTEKREVKPKETPVKVETSQEQIKGNIELPQNSSKNVSGSQTNSTSPKAQVPTNIKTLYSETRNVGNVKNASPPGKAPPSTVKQARPPEERKLELEGAPKTRKINPLDRVVAKLSGKTEGSNQISGNPVIDNDAPVIRGAVKNVTVNLTELMNNTDEEIEDEDTDNTMSDVDNEHEKSELRKEREAEERRLRDFHESQLKNLRDSLNKEYKAMEERVRNDHKNALAKFEEQEKQKLEQMRKQIESNLKQKNEKLIENTKDEMEKNLTEMKSKMIKDLERENEEEIEKLKMRFVLDMKNTKEKLQKDHDEELKDLEQELQALYSQQKLAKQEELDAQKASAASRNSKQKAAAAAVDELEQSVTELLREKQRDLKKEHNKQLAILSDELEMELEKAARQAKDKETQEKRSHASRLAKMKDGHEEEVKHIEKLYEQELQDLETEHEKDVFRLKAQFKAELTQQKTELENKLIEFRIEYEQKLSCLEDEQEVEEHESSHIDDIPPQNFEQKDEVPRSSKDQKDKTVTDECVVENNKESHEDEKNYSDLLRELRERRKNLEKNLEELKTQENMVKELKVQKQASCTPHSPCSNITCIHASKYKKLKDKYSTLVNRIKSEKAKRASKKPSSFRNPIINTTPSLSSDKSSLSSVNVSENNDVTSSTSSPRKVRTCSFSTIDASEDEDVRLATQVLKKYGKNVDYGNSKHSLLLKKRLTSTPKNAWVEDELLAAGKRELKKTEEFLNSGILKHHPTLDLDVEGIHKEFLRQNASYQASAFKKSGSHLSLARGGSISSDTESDDPVCDPTQDLLAAPDYGLNKLLGQLNSANRPVFSETKIPGPRRGKTQPLRPSASLERGLNNITQPYTDYINRFSTLSPFASGGLKRLNSGSVPDLGPETVDRIASINQYLQQRWTSYFGELSVPLGGKAGWPSHVIGQSTLLSGKNTTDNVLINNSINSSVPPKMTTVVSNKSPLKQPNLKEDNNLNQKIDDLRVWLEKAHATSAAVAVEKLGQTGTLQ